jgi:hypothetical protein
MEQKKFSKQSIYLLTAFAFIFFLLISVKTDIDNKKIGQACNFREQKIAKIDGSAVDDLDILWMVTLDSGESVTLANLAEIGQSVLIATKCQVDRHIQENEIDLKNDDLKKVVLQSDGKYLEIKASDRIKYVKR